MKRACVLVILLLLTLGTAAHAESTNPSDVDIDRTFGVVEAYYRPAEAAQLGARWERVVFSWHFFQPTGPDEFNASVIPSYYLDNAQAAGRQIVGLIKGTPHWVTPVRSVGAVPNNLDLPFDHPDNYYGAFVTRLVEHYSQRGIHHWIIMNEPDVRPGEGVVEFQGNEHDYYRMLKVAYLAIKAVDPGAQVQIAGMAWWPDRMNGRQPYLLRLLREISQDPDACANNFYFDGVNIHIYFTTSTIWPIFTEIRGILARYGLTGKALWLSEFNASPRTDPQAPSSAQFQTSLQQQADYVVQASALGLAAGVERLSVYRMYDDQFNAGTSEPWGLVRSDGSLRPAYYAYQQAIARFSGAREAYRYHIPEATVVALVFPETTVYVLWSETFTSGEFLLHGGGLEGAYSVTNAAGEAQVIPVVEESRAPLLIVEAPGAQRTPDFDGVLVAGEVRIVELPGRPRTIWYRTEDGRVGQVR
jgi:hypothetical protein